MANSKYSEIEKFEIYNNTIKFLLDLNHLRIELYRTLINIISTVVIVHFELTRNSDILELGWGACPRRYQVKIYSTVSNTF